jgi:hypothetical protein
MSSVGYGDIYPSTHIGRFLTLACAFFGAFILSLTVTAVGNLMAFEENKKDAFVRITKEQVAC